jgi:hypothetical protein
MLLALDIKCESEEELLVELKDFVKIFKVDKVGERIVKLI